MAVEIKSENGYLEISDRAISTIVGISVYGCYGIVGFPVKKISDGITEFLGKENIDKGVKIYTNNNKLVIDIYVILEYGVKITAIAENIISTVKYNVNQYTNVEVDKVNVYVESVRIEK